MKKIYLPVMILALATSCQKDNITNSSDAMAQKDILITTNLDSYSRAGIADTDLQNFVLSIDQEGEELDYSNVFVSKQSDDSWKPYESGEEGASEKTMKWYNMDSPTDVIAVYRNNEKNLKADGNIVGFIPAIQREETSKTTEILYFNNKVTPGKEGVINVKFTHLFSKIEVTPDLSSMTDAVLTNVYIYQTYNNYIFTPNDGSILINKDKGTTRITPYLVESSSKYEAILLPQEMKNAFISVVFTLPNPNNQANRITYKQTAVFPEGFELKSGMNYSITLPVDDPTAPATPTSRAGSNHMNIVEKEWCL